MKDEETKTWPWNPPTPYDEDPPDNYPHNYSIWVDLFWTCVAVAVVFLVILVASKVFP